MRAGSLMCLAIAVVGAALACPAAFAAGSGKGGVGLKQVGRFDQPTYVAAAPGEKGVFVVEQPGRIKLLRKGKSKKFLDIVLLLSIADKPIWWIILCFIPLVNIVIMVLIWMGAASAMGK